MNRLLSPQTPSQSPALCLRTHSDGTIPLNCSPLDLFNQAAPRFDNLYLQSKHDFARLVAIIEPPTLDWVEIGSFAYSPDHRFILHPAATSQLLSRVQHCDCCGSPGRVELRNEHGQERLQLCAPNQIPAYQWGRYVQALSQTKMPVPATGTPRPFPRIPGNTTELPFHPFLLATLLSLLSDQGRSVEVTLVNEVSSNRRPLKPDIVEVEDTLLTCSSPLSSLQLDLAAVEKLSLALTAKGAPQLYASGPDRSQLLLLEAADTPEDRRALTDILHDHIPELI
ncbi:hypothetical protein [Pelagicoccus sp. SDUM812005]|uniref:hypothetical protein n=1 Tax=Pelagicoccus sp. SDUM812005 TaxID=3041257 RepID=UPI00280ECEBD|nr:hypothetical protein [Pelagicoccus sp. SDUM812005]MDQ8181205.1 hypothetical protein [Pelagicoccus sp. SDUM812005]